MFSVDDSGVFAGVWFVLKRDEMPAAMMPGCMPKNGVSKLMVPKMLCLGEIPGSRKSATSDASIPPML